MAETPIIKHPATEDAERIESIKRKLEEHGKYALEHDLTYEQHMDAHISKGENRFTIGEKIGDISTALEKVLEDYLGIVNIEGANAKDYLSELNLTETDLKEMYQGQENVLFTQENAHQLKSVLKDKITHKLRGIIQSEIKQLKTEQGVNDALKYILTEAGAEDDLPGYEGIVDPAKAADLSARYVNPIMEKYQKQAKNVEDLVKPDKELKIEPKDNYKKAA